MKSDVNLRKMLREGRTLYGPWCVIPSASVINVIATTGVDFVIIDMEHGPHGMETVEQMVRAAQSEGCEAIVRVAKNEETMILQALDLGSSGVIVPHIESREDAENAVGHARYYPAGHRGFSPYTRAGRYSMNNVKDHARLQNEQTALILLLEGRKGIDNLKDILSIPDIQGKIDAIYIGAYDLSQALGYPGQVDHPEVREKLSLSIAAIREKGIAAGGYVAKNEEDIKWMTDMGMQFITLLPDCTILFHSFETFFPGIPRRGIEI